MLLKVKPRVKNEEISLKNLINGLDHIDYDRLQERAMDILEDEARVNVFLDTPTPTQMMSALHAMHGHIERASKASMPTRTDSVTEYENDNNYKLQMADGIQRVNEKLLLDKTTIPIHRNYELQSLDDNTMFINFSKPEVQWHNYVELHLNGFYMIDMDAAAVKTIPTTPPIVMKSGPAIYTKGRDVMISALFSSVPDILNMMKRVILRNMGIY